MLRTRRVPRVKGVGGAASPSAARASCAKGRSVLRASRAKDAVGQGRHCHRGAGLRGRRRAAKVVAGLGGCGAGLLHRKYIDFGGLCPVVERATRWHHRMLLGGGSGTFFSGHNNNSNMYVLDASIIKS